MDREWFGLDGYPCTFAESPTGSALILAITAVPGSENYDDQRIERSARLLFSAYQQGRDENLARNQPATQKVTDAEIRSFYALAEKLAIQIDQLHQPAVSAMFAEGLNPFSLADQLRRAMENAHHAFGSAAGSEKAPGRPKKFDARYATEMARHVYEHISDRRATFTTDTKTGAVSGPWPDFLGKVFAALRIEASVASQVRPASEETSATEG